MANSNSQAMMKNAIKNKCSSVVGNIICTQVQVSGVIEKGLYLKPQKVIIGPEISDNTKILDGPKVCLSTVSDVMHCFHPGSYNSLTNSYSYNSLTNYELVE